MGVCNSVSETSKLSRKNLKLLTRQFNLTSEQIECIIENFDNDSLEDGSLDRHGFLSLYSKLRSEPEEKLEELSSHLFEVFDVDKSNSISFHEFLVKFFSRD